ncbi:MAG TPA: cysteine--tRNA ligase [Candidatus Thermoplasmatota archaeon]|nr:cysteine--tRNA ligase [Candidatus Thermoplasmatota archaeon]
MALTAYNVRTRRKEPFVPLDPAGGKVGLYLCGLTVYDHAHIGHARTAVAFEVIRRWLERHYKLTFVQNVTDVDDRIIDRARELGVSPREHAAKWDRVCEEAMARLGVRPPDQAPHVTRSIPQIVAFIEGILAKGMAYATREGNVYFDVPRYDEAAQRVFPQCTYGTLSNRDFREMAAGTRKGVEDDKLHPADFALWKAAKAGDHPDASWPSPWGTGRPGWHIECSVMATEALGDRIDIHGGGQDLIFPHHENEIAQSQAKTGQAPFVNLWMHAGFLNVEGEKMSKSLGNFIVLADLLDELPRMGMDAETLRFYFLQTHYRSKIDYQRRGLDEAHTALARLHRTRDLLADAARTGPGHPTPEAGEACRAFRDGFAAALDDDFHTPMALSVLFEMAKRVNPSLEAGTLAGPDAKLYLATFEECGIVLTLFQQPPRATQGKAAAAATLPPALEAFARGHHVATAGRAPQQVLDDLVRLRAEARAAKDWKRGDAIRDALKAAGYLIEDTAAGQRWRPA